MIKEYDIVTIEEGKELPPDGYEEIEIEEFLRRENASESEEIEFYRKYGFPVNIHKILAEDTLDDCLDLLQKSQVDRRLEKLNAVVFLLLKPKGSRNNLTSLRDVKKYKELIEFAVSNNINIGFDSCGANKFLEAVKGMKNYDTYKMLAEPCESAAFSVYVNVDGRAFPCSFGEGTPGWEEGIDVVNCRDFIRDVWEGEKFRDFRHRAQQNKRSCVFYNI